MSTQPIAIAIVLLLAIGVLFVGWFAVAAAQLPSRISDSEDQAEIPAAQQRATDVQD